MRATQASDLIHGIVVLSVCIMATIYVTLNAPTDSNNIWIVYGSAIAYAAGRAGASISSRRRSDDPPNGNGSNR